MAYAITVHKCQGLSLDCAIVDLSDEVLCAGMTYVAVSRVRSLDGHLLIRLQLSCPMIASRKLIDYEVALEMIFLYMKLLSKKRHS